MSLSGARENSRFGAAWSSSWVVGNSLAILKFGAFVLLAIGLSASYVYPSVLEQVIGSTLVLAAGWLIYRRSGSLTATSPTGWFYLLFVVFVYIGTLMISVGITLSFADPVDPHLIPLAGFIVCFAIGVRLTDLFTSFSPREETRSFLSRYPEDEPSERFTSIVLYLVAPLLAGSIVFSYAQYGIPLVDPLSFASWRSASGYVVLALRLLLPTIALFLLAKGWTSQNRRTWVGGMLAFGFIVIALLLTGKRYPILDFAIWVLFFLSYVLGLDTRQMTRYVAGFGIFAVPIVLIIPAIRSGSVIGADESIITVLWRPIRNRIFLSEATGVNYLLTYFHSEHGFYGPTYLSDKLSGLIPGRGPSISLGGWLYERAFAGTGGFIPPTLAGQFYASGGVVAMLFGGVLWGILLQYVFTWTVRAEHTALSIVLVAVFNGLLARSFITGFIFSPNQLKYILGLFVVVGLVSVKTPRFKNQ